MAKIPSEMVPVTVDEEILDFCQHIVADAVPILVPIRPWNKAIPRECFDNVERYVSEYGGYRVLGWRPMRWANIMLEAEAHAIWQSPTGELVDITPFEQSESLFVPDCNMVHAGYIHANIRHPMTDSPLIAELIGNLSKIDSLRSGIRSGESFSAPRELLERNLEIRRILNEDVSRNDSCPCQSGLKYKKCCGRFQQGS